MKSRLTIARRINFFVTTLATAVTVVLSCYGVVSSYRQQLNSIEAGAAWQSGEGVRHQLGFYYSDSALLQTLMRDVASHPAIERAAAYSLEGDQLAEYLAPGVDAYPLTDFSVLRGNTELLEIGRLNRRIDTSGYYDLTVPVYSDINPLEKDISRADYGDRLAAEDPVASQYLIGYYHFGINKLALFQSLRPALQQIALYGLGGLLLTLFLTYSFTRGIAASLASLADMASEISKGHLDKKFRPRGKGEIREIASMLNVILGELKKHKAKMDADSHLLRMKVDERTEQLSRQNKQLNEAVRQVTRTKNKLRQLAYYDGLTELPNRQLFTEQLDILLRMAQREGRTIALLFLDLDNFKRINDSLGHSAGDVLLREVAARLASCVRGSDLLAKYVDSEAKIGVSRLGGDEFTVVLNSIDEPKTAGVIAERLLESLQEPMHIEGHEVVVTPSVGIALAPQDADNVEDLLKLADTAMYHAKSQGRNKYSFYTSSMQSAGVGRLKLETELRKALEREELVLHYQPQICTATGKVLGAEALVRWEHPEHGLVPPIRFIPLAEEMGLIVELGAWTLEEAARQSKRLKDLGIPVPKIAVNVSALQFNPSFTKQVQAVLDSVSIPPSCIELELTEGVIMNNAKASIESLHGLKELGVSLSVDDFGTGYSSLSYLSKFPLDELKIDRSFVIEFDKSENSASLVSAIIAMGKSLNLSLVAEGVDNPEQFLFLRQQQVEIIQGYLFSKPLPSRDFEATLREAHFPRQIEEIVRQQELRKQQRVATEH
ncbi:MAG: EAL domain-containing protein [Pseudomonadota bacterium]